MEESGNHNSADETQKVEMDNGNEMATEDDYEPLQQTQSENENSHSVVKSPTVSEEFATEIPVMNSAASFYATQLEPKRENIMSLSDEHGGISLVSDLVAKEIEPSLEKQVLPASDEKVQAPDVEAGNGGEDCSMSLVPRGIETQESEEEEEVLPTSDENVVEVAYSLEPKEVNGDEATSSGTENDNMSQVPKDIENKPIIASTLKARTSWMDCCGLFDYLKRSN